MGVPENVAATEPLGRIVSASLQSFEADCFELDAGPALGTLVITADGLPAVYGVVSSIVTQGADPSRPIAPHGAPDEDLATVHSRHPHLPILLRTTFVALVAAYEDPARFPICCPTVLRHCSHAYAPVQQRSRVGSFEHLTSWNRSCSEEIPQMM